MILAALVCLLAALGAAWLGVAAARVGRWVHAAHAGVCCLLAVYVCLWFALAGPAGGVV